jgi:hypothetical protein
MVDMLEEWCAMDMSMPVIGRACADLLPTMRIFMGGQCGVCCYAMPANNIFHK